MSKNRAKGKIKVNQNAKYYTRKIKQEKLDKMSIEKLAKLISEVKTQDYEYVARVVHYNKFPEVEVRKYINRDGYYLERPVGTFTKYQAINLVRNLHPDYKPYIG